MNVEEFAHAMTVTAEGFGAAEAVAVNKAAGLLRVEEIAQAGNATHGTLVLRGIPGMRPIGVRVTAARPTQDVPFAIVAGVPGGIWTWLETGTKKHLIGAGREGRGGRGRTGAEFDRRFRKGLRDRKLLHFSNGDGDVATGPFMGGRLPAKHTFSKGVAAVAPLIPKIVEKEIGRQMLRSLKG